MKTNRLACLIFALFLLACGKDEYSDIPNAYVNLTLDLTFEDRELNAMMAHKIYTKENVNTSQREAVGFGGVVVYHSSYTQGVFHAYDIACPHESKQNITINIEPYSGTGMCPVCKSVYDLETGSPISGPSSENPTGKHLRAYRIISSGNKIHISN